MHILSIFGTALGCGITMAFGFFLGAWAVRVTMFKGEDKRRWEWQVGANDETHRLLREANYLRRNAASLLGCVADELRCLREYAGDIRGKIKPPTPEEIKDKDEQRPDREDVQPVPGELPQVSELHP